MHVHTPAGPMVRTHRVEPLEGGSEGRDRGWYAPLNVSARASHADSAQHRSRLSVTIVLFSQGRASLFLRFAFSSPFRLNSLFVP